MAFEYHVPVAPEFEHQDLGRQLVLEEPNFIDWLETEAIENIRLIHIPFGRTNAKYYYFFQVLSGFPQTEGAISRVPDSAYNYIRSNDLLNAWHQQQPVSCQRIDRSAYLAALDQLEADGFSHVVYHPQLLYAEAIKDSFRVAEPSYEDDYVWIFRLNDLRASCTEAQSEHQAFTRAYADALQKRSIPRKRHGTLVVFPPSDRARDSLARYIQHFAQIDSAVASITSNDRDEVEVSRLDSTATTSSADLEKFAALRVVNSPQEYDAAQTPAFQDWFAKRFHFCLRFFEDESTTIDAYLRADIPCSAIDQSSALEVRYEDGVRLHNASFDVAGDTLHFYLAWTDLATGKYSFSLQFFDEYGQKALQYDSVIRHLLLSTHEIDAASLKAGVYSIQLVVYDFETQVSQGGVIAATSERFTRELEIAKIEWNA